MRKPKILIWDLETLPNICYAFDLYSYKKPDMIIQEKAIISFAYKWLGDKKANVIKGNHNHPYDDKALVEQIIEVISQADYLVAHFGDKFDSRFLRSRALINGVKAPPPVKQIDTYKLAKKYFHLNANRLDYLGKILGVGRKNSTSWKLWEKCAEGNKKAINEMAEYNKQDVELLEAVFLKMLPHTTDTLNRRLFSIDAAVCPHCGSTHLQKRGTMVNKATKRQRYQCQSCYSWSTGKYVETQACIN